MRQLLVFLLCSVAWAGSSSFYVGILEPPIIDDEELATRYRLRAVFQFDGVAWTPVRQSPHEATWHLVLSGAAVGTVKTTLSREASNADPAWTSYRTSIHDVPPNSALPKLPAAHFSTWLGQYQYRPVAATTGPHFADPAGWKPYVPSPAEWTAAKRAYQHAVANDPLCRSEQSYDDEWIQSVGPAYRSKSGDWLITLQFDPSKDRCDSPGWNSICFLFHGSEPKKLGSRMVFLDAADFDGDGASELLFHYDDYNLNGYILVHVPALTQTKFLWSYH